MKKSLFITILICVLIGVGLHIYLPYVTLDMITNYEPYTFERVFESAEMRAEYGIFDNSSPADYSFEYETIDFPALDSVVLNGWYIKAKRPSSRSLVLIHGRTSNRLKTMKYLALVDSLDLDTTYNVFIPDLRNSGRSAVATTYMGYKFGEDVAAALLMLHNNFGQDTMMIYAFSMGAMAVCNTLGRPELSGMLQSHNIVVEKIIFDSPLVNVKETLRDQFEQIPVVEFYFEKTYNLYSQKIQGFADHMRLSELLPNDIPVLILQSKNDQTTRNKFLELELAEMMDFQNVRVIYFDEPGHVKIFQDENHRVHYLNSVSEFLIYRTTDSD